jgi:D-tyrosyl-tRNA(Tyr) deacylase
VIGLLQRVSQARVVVDGETVGAIGRGLLVLVCAERGDGEEQARRLLARLLAFRVFPDEAGRMNRSLAQLAQEAPGEAGLLLVPQFTLAADTRKGTRASFTTAAPPAQAAPLFDVVVQQARARHAGPVATGRFGADMKVSLLNDGPVTFWLESGPSTGDAG